MNQKKTTTIYRVVICGPSCVGKTCFIDRLINNTFNNNSKATVSTNRQNFYWQWESTTLHFLIYDTSGQLRFLTSMLSLFTKDCDIVIFLYELSNNNSLTEIKNLYVQLKEHNLL